MEELRKVTIRHAADVNSKLSEKSRRIDLPVAESAAKYYLALKQLADK